MKSFIKQIILFLLVSLFTVQFISGQEYTEILQKKRSDTYEIINFGVNGYNILQEAEYLREKVIAYNPDHVVFCITYNDLQLHSGEIDILNEKMKHLNQSGLYKTYYAYRLTLLHMLLRFHTVRHLP